MAILQILGTIATLCSSTALIWHHVYPDEDWQIWQYLLAYAVIAVTGIFYVFSWSKIAFFCLVILTIYVILFAILDSDDDMLEIRVVFSLTMSVIIGVLFAFVIVLVTTEVKYEFSESQSYELVANGGQYIKMDGEWLTFFYTNGETIEKVRARMGKDNYYNVETAMMNVLADKSATPRVRIENRTKIMSFWVTGEIETYEAKPNYDLYIPISYAKSLGF